MAEPVAIEPRTNHRSVREPEQHDDDAADDKHQTAEVPGDGNRRQIDLRVWPRGQRIGRRERARMTGVPAP